MENLEQTCKLYLDVQGSGIFVSALAQTEIRAEELSRIFKCKMPSSQFLFKMLKIFLEIKKRNNLPLFRVILQSLKVLRSEKETLFRCSYEKAKEYNMMRIRDLPKQVLVDLFALFSLDFLDIIKEKILEIWKSQNYSNAIELALKFDLLSLLGSDLELIDFLATKKAHSAIIYLINNSCMSAEIATEYLLQSRRTKTASKLIKKLKLNERNFPEFLKQEAYKFIKYILLSPKAHMPLLQAMEKLDPELIAVAITALHESRLHWTSERAAQIMFNNPNADRFLDRAVVAALQSYPKRELNGLPDKFGPLHPSLELSIDPNIDTKVVDKLEDIQFLEWSSNIVGIDFEHSGSYSQVYVSLMQVAMKHSIYIIDIQEIGHSSDLVDKINSLLGNSGILKLGIGLLHDLELLQKDFKGIAREITNYEDISELYKQSVQDCEGGLATICSKVLHKPLCKAEQCSNWAKRPLRQSQLHYAALDAHVLLLLWEKLQSGIEIKEISYGDRCKICGRFFHGPEDCDN